MIDPGDEAPHPPGEGAHWQESWYFNWYDVHHRQFGLARIGYLPNAGRTQALVLTVRDGRSEFLYPGLLAMDGDWADLDPARGLRAGLLDVTMEKPLKRWRLRLFGTDAMDLTFETFTSPFDFTGGERRMAENMTSFHFEQSGRVQGWTCFNGDRVEVDGYGQRDKSWGVRHWQAIEGWNWISAQFAGGPGGGATLAFNATETFLGGTRYPNGFVHRDGENHALTSVEVQHRWGAHPHVPAETGLVLADAGGAELEVTAHATGQFPLFRGGCLIQETPARFVLAGGGEGYGVVEHVWRPGVLASLVRVPEMAGAVVPVLGPLRRVFR